MNKQRSKHACGGFTLVEMLVVIGIIGIMSIALFSSFSHLKTAARQAQAQSLVAEVATAFTAYLQKEREWPDEWVGENGGPSKTEMDDEVCLVFQKKRMIDLTTYKVVKGEYVLNKESLDRFGLLDPFARAALQRNPTDSKTAKVPSGGTFESHRLQFRLDTNYDGFVDSSDKFPPPKNIRVRASAIVWSRGPDGKDDFESKSGRYPDDDRLSWPYGKSRGKTN